MMLFSLLSCALAAATLRILVHRRSRAPRANPGDARPVADVSPSLRLRWGLSAVILVVVGGGYAAVGSPRLLPVGPDAPTFSDASVRAQSEVLQLRAERDPGNAKAWIEAARFQASSGHAQAAIEDDRRALALRPRDANLMVEIAEMLAASSETGLDGEPIDLVEQALAIEPDHVKALALEGGHALARQDVRGAVAAWTHALALTAPEDPMAVFLRAQLDVLRNAEGFSPPHGTTAPTAR